MPAICTLNRICLAAGFFFATATFANAVVILPTLPPGSQYQLVFVSANGRDATSNNIADYNQFVAQEAAANSLLPITTWSAIASTSTINAISNATTFTSVPIYNTHGQLVANGTSDFWFPVHSSLINYDQYGLLTEGYVWTGTNPNGTAANYLGSASQVATYGRSEVAAPGEWTFASIQANFVVYPFYSLSAPITVPVPEPGALELLVSAVLVLSGMLLCRRFGVVITRQ